MMLGMSLDLKLSDFKRIILAPKAPVIGLITQFLLMPAMTFLLILVLKPIPSIALGMILIAACPGGNLSNIVTYLAKGNAAVSISMTAVSTAAAVVMTPLNLALWGELYTPTSLILKKVHLSPTDVFVTIFLILGIPLILGLTLSHFFPNLADKVRRPFKIFSFLFFIIFVVFALKANWSIFIDCIGLIIFAVFLHNGVAFLTGYSAGKIFRLDDKDLRAVTIEVGLQNSALGMILAIQFFDGLGGTAIIAAWWGVWHIISGLSLATFWSLRPPSESKQLQHNE
jgi:BASS family bile acid:Na+ symporter